jgi:hypothetical protein
MSLRSADIGSVVRTLDARRAPDVDGRSLPLVVVRCERCARSVVVEVNIIYLWFAKNIPKTFSSVVVVAFVVVVA